MYRKRNGSLGFSFTRFANAAVPNFFSDPTPAFHLDLTGHRRDMCYMHQIASTNPYALDERSFFAAGIADTESVSKRVYAKLKKCEILREDGTVDTYKIGPRFTHQLALINMNRQKDLVGMLFWWEEECQRLRKLDAEEKDLDAMIAEAELRITQTDDDTVERQNTKESADQLRFARERIRMKRRQRPSQRDPDVEADQDDIMGAFHGRSKSVPNVGVHTSEAGRTKQENVGNPPQYFFTT